MLWFLHEWQVAISTKANVLLYIEHMFYQKKHEFKLETIPKSWLVHFIVILKKSLQILRRDSHGFLILLTCFLLHWDSCITPYLIMKKHLLSISSNFRSVQFKISRISQRHVSTSLLITSGSWTTPTTDHRPPATDHRPLTTSHRPIDNIRIKNIWLLYNIKCYYI